MANPSKPKPSAPVTEQLPADRVDTASDAAGPASAPSAEVTIAWGDISRTVPVSRVEGTRVYVTHEGGEHVFFRETGECVASPEGQLHGWSISPADLPSLQP